MKKVNSNGSEQSVVEAARKMLGEGYQVIPVPYQSNNPSEGFSPLPENVLSRQVYAEAILALEESIWYLKPHIDSALNAHLDVLVDQLWDAFKEVLEQIPQIGKG